VFQSALKNNSQSQILQIMRNLKKNSIENEKSKLCQELERINRHYRKMMLIAYLIFIVLAISSLCIFDVF